MIGLSPAASVANISDVEWDRSVSVTSTIFRLTRVLGWSDLVALLLVILIFLAVVSAVIWIARPGLTNVNAMTSLEWSVLIVLALAFSPQTTSRHMVLLLLVYVVALAVLQKQNERRMKIALIGDTVVEEKIGHDAGAKSPQSLTKEGIIRLIRKAGKVPVERDTLYHPIRSF